MTPIDDTESAAITRAWKAAGTELPPTETDAALRAAARRAVLARPKRERHMRNWPLAAAAVVATLAIGILHLAPTEDDRPGEIPSSNLGGPESGLAAAKREASPPAGAPAPQATAPQVAAMIAPAADEKAKVASALEPERKDRPRTTAAAAAPAAARVDSGATVDPAKQRAEQARAKASADSQAPADKLETRQVPSATAEAFPAEPARRDAEPARRDAERAPGNTTGDRSAATTPAENRSRTQSLRVAANESADDVTKPAAPAAPAAAQAPAPAPSPSTAARAPAAASPPAAAAPAPGAAPPPAAANTTVAAAGAVAKDAAVKPPEEWIKLIRRLRSEGQIEASNRELAAFRAAYRDRADALLPPDLRAIKP